jgi:hypothetical protein
MLLTWPRARRHNSLRQDQNTASSETETEIVGQIPFSDLDLMHDCSDRSNSECHCLCLDKIAGHVASLFLLKNLRYNAYD